jgi:MFS family permease
MSIPVKPSNANFRLLVAGQTVTLFGSALLRFALSLHVLDVTGRADLFSILYAISAAPLLLSPVGGAIADRVNRRNLMVAIDAANGIITLALIIMMFFGNGSIAVIAATMFLFGVTSAIESPTVMASVPSVAPSEKLEQANGIINGIGSLAQIAAPVLGGILYGIMGLNALLIASCTAFFLASGMEMFIRMPFEKRSRKRRMITTIATDMKEGFSYVRNHSDYARNKYPNPRLTRRLLTNIAYTYILYTWVEKLYIRNGWRNTAAKAIPYEKFVTGTDCINARPCMCGDPTRSLSKSIWE